MEKLIKSLEALIEKSEGAEREQYQAELIEAIKKDARDKAEAEAKKEAEEAKNKAAEEERKNKAFAADANPATPKIEIGVGDEHKGVKVRKVMDGMKKYAAKSGRPDYMKGQDEEAEFVARFWIDKALSAKYGPVEKANELVTTTATLGGNLTPTEQESAILDYMMHTSVALQDANVVSMTSDVMTVPYIGDAPAVTIESAETSITQDTPTFNLATLTTKRHSSYVPVSWEMEMNETAGLAAYLADKFYEDLGVKIDSAVFCETGTIVQGSGVLAGGYGLSTVLATASTNFSSIYASVFPAAVGALYPERRVGAKWYMQYSNLWAYVAPLAHLSGGTETPLYDRANKSIEGFPVREIRQGPATAASTAMAVLGNLKHFIIGSRLINTNLIKIPEKTGMTNYVYWTNVAYANPLTSAFSAIVTGAGS